MIFYNSFNIKLMFFLLSILLLKPPLNNISDFIFILITISLIYLSKVRDIPKYNYSLISILVSVILFVNFFDNKKIDEAHSIFFSKEDIKTLSEYLPNKIINDIEIKYNNEFNFLKALESHDSDIFSSQETFSKNKFINNAYAFSSDNLFQRSKLSRKVNTINFNSREDLRIGQINTLNFNLAFDKEFRRDLPFYVLYKIPPINTYSKICGEGNLYYSKNKNKITNVRNLEFNKFNSKCLVFDNEEKETVIIGFSINKDDHLRINIEKNNIHIILNILILIFKFIFIFIFFKIFLKFNRFSNSDLVIFLLTFLSSIILIVLKDSNLITGLRYFRGGADGLFHEHQAYQIIRHIYFFNIYEALKGGENTFYFMPGLRYLIALNKIIFGETSYGYLIIGFLLPLFVYKLLKNLITEKISFYLLISFLIFPIFENMGFGHFNYIHQIMRNHAETFSIFLIIFCLYKITSFDFDKKVDVTSAFLCCLLLSIATFCRPNYLPTTTIIFLFFLIKFYKINIYIFLFGIIGYSFVFLSLFHNLYFDNNFALFTESSVHFVFNEVFQNLNLNYKDNILLKQIYKWNPLYYTHRLLILLFVIYCYFKFKKNLISTLLITCTLSQHLVLLLTHPDSRYAYLAWLLTFITFVYYFFNYSFINLKK